ncbi:Phosphopantothenate--cysteine ligase cab2 [Polyrhizophydium stewartii]|uniref:Phosphopantothenate--cysteine ligase cab2 n=1 Tax=Polyrhizophydium stewartii TaxID=2732419 RepID=A0ABR4NK93_9FUNG|nr:hypothetical protein HK105_006358 [Polyrhizophydium stewartii]
MDAQEYFDTTPAPQGVEDVAQRVREFVEHNQRLSRRVVLVSSGGTTVPLEANTVRFLDNFSAGTRGAASAEHFIASGYGVIFLHRQFSLEPYTRHFTHSKNCFLDFLERDAAAHERAADGGAASSGSSAGHDARPRRGSLRVAERLQAEIAEVFDKYQAARAEHRLLKIDFVTVHDYLFLLRRITMEMSPLGKLGMYYLAAAVSDYFIPQAKMAVHKIQSGDGALTLSLEQVPKIIKPLVQEWAEHGFIVSFKLETDDAMLLPKARKALERYGHQLVIGNMLHTRKHVVHFISADRAEEIRLTPDEVAANFEIETHIISRLVGLHSEWIARE